MYEHAADIWIWMCDADLDDLFAYETTKKVKVRDFRLGFTAIALKTVVLAVSLKGVSVLHSLFLTRMVLT